MNTESELLTLAQAAAYCGCLEHELLELCRSPSGPAFVPSFHKKDLDDWMTKPPVGPRSSHRLDHIRPGFFNGCWIEPVGVYRHGASSCSYLVYRDGRGQGLAIPRMALGKASIEWLFEEAPTDLRTWWPCHSKTGRVVGWDPGRAEESLRILCVRSGPVGADFDLSQCLLFRKGKR